MFFLLSQPDPSSLQASSKLTMTTVRPKMKKKIESSLVRELGFPRFLTIIKANATIGILTLAWKPLPLLSERNNTALVTAAISVTANDSMTISF